MGPRLVVLRRHRPLYSGRKTCVAFRAGYRVDIILRFVLVWFLQEGPFVYMSLVGTVATSDGIFAELCKYYIILHAIHLIFAMSVILSED